MSPLFALLLIAVAVAIAVGVRLRDLHWGQGGRSRRGAGRAATVPHLARRVEQTIRGVEPATAKQEAAYDHWLERAADRQEGRRGRLAETAPVVPPVVWSVLILAGLLVIGYICLYADPAEPVFVQAFMMAAVVTLVASGLLLVRFLDRSYEEGSGSVRPVVMEWLIKSMEQAHQAEGAAFVPCDAQGVKQD